MEILLELIGELVIQLVLELLADGGLHLVGRRKREARPATRVCGYLLLGAIFGGLSLLVFRESFITSGQLQMVNLAITPVIAGSLMALIGRSRTRRGKQALPLERFAGGFAFAFALALVRFLWAC